jgi:hypothetical protein
MVWRNRRSPTRELVGVVVFFEAVLVGGLGPGPPRPSMFALQRGSASTPLSGRRINNRHCVARGCAGCGFVSESGRRRGRGGVDGAVLYLRARGRVGRLDLFRVNVVPP